jgi:hypothetical protein
MLIAGYAVFHSDQVEAVAEGKRSVGHHPVESRLEGTRPDTHLYSWDTKRPRTAQLEEELVLL